MRTTTDITVATKILNDRLNAAAASNAAVIERIQNEVPEDSLVLRPSAAFSAEGEELVMSTPTKGGVVSRPLTRYALGQAAGAVHFPAAYAAEVMEKRGAIGRKVVADALTTLYRAEPAQRQVGQAKQTIQNRMLVRSVRGRIHGIMSDAYRRLDSRPGVDAFSRAAQAVGAMPYEATITDTRIAIKAILRQVFLVGPEGSRYRDAVAIGVTLRNSDFGAGRYSIAMFILRVLCGNGMIGEMLLAQAHIGSRLDEADFYSDKTHKLDSDTMVSATQDYVRAFLAPDGIERTVGVLQSASSRELNFEAELNGALKKAMTKEELKSVTAALQSVNEEEMPLGPPSAYRMANALSWIAKTAEPDRRLDLERLAGDYLKEPAEKKAA